MTLKKADEAVQLPLFPDLPLRIGVPFKLAKKRRVRFAELLEHSCSVMQITRSELESSIRRRYVARPRHIIMYLAYQDTNFSTTKIGELLGERDHTTVMHGCRRIESLAEDDEVYSLVTNIRAKYYREEAPP